MPYGRITPKQQEILDYIKNEILNRGFPPAVREICEAVNLKSTSSVHSHLEALEKNGYIRRDATKPRAIEIIDDNFNLVGLITIKDIEKSKTRINFCLLIVSLYSHPASCHFDMRSRLTTQYHSDINYLYSIISA